MKENFYIELIYKSFSNELSAEEQQQLDDWSKASKENQAELTNLQNAWKLSANYSKNLTINLDEEFAILEQRIAKEDQLAAIIKPLEPDRSKSSGRLRWLGAAAAVLLLAGAFFVFQKINSPEVPMLTMQTQTGKVSEIELADGTKVWINENSSFSYPETFTGRERKVKLKGEAFFEVTKSPNHPFVIETEETEVKVLGTSFSVRAYDNEPVTEVLVKTGKVQLRPTKGKYQPLDLTKNQKGSFDKTTKDYERTKQAIENNLSWQNRQLIFDEMPLKKAILDVENYFDIKIELENKILSDCPFSSNFSQPNLKEVLDALSGFLNMTAEQTNQKTYQLKGGQMCTSVE